MAIINMPRKAVTNYDNRGGELRSVQYFLEGEMLLPSTLNYGAALIVNSLVPQTPL